MEAQREAEQKARNLEIFSELGQSAYEITHRLGNDLGLIKTYINRISDFLKEQSIPSALIDEELENIVKDVGRVLKMSKGLKKNVAGLQEGGKPAVTPVTIPVKELLEEAKLAHFTLPAGVSLVWEIADDLGEVKVVTSQIVDILTALVTNAIEAMPQGGQINVRAEKSSSDVHIEVADNGPGISAPNQSKIFNLFFSTKDSSGFGLWSARRYANANGGDLKMHSQLGEGATFTLRLPLVVARN
jgi:signal transduction histidine kinase